MSLLADNLIWPPMTNDPSNAKPSGHDHSQIWFDPGFDIPDLNYHQLDTLNVKIGPREGVIRMGFLDHYASPFNFLIAPIASAYKPY